MRIQWRAPKTVLCEFNPVNNFGNISVFGLFSRILHPFLPALGRCCCPKVYCNWRFFYFTYLLQPEIFLLQKSFTARDFCGALKDWEKLIWLSPIAAHWEGGGGTFVSNQHWFRSGKYLITFGEGEKYGGDFAKGWKMICRWWKWEWVWEHRPQGSDVFRELVARNDRLRRIRGETQYLKLLHTSIPHWTTLDSTNTH